MQTTPSPTTYLRQTTMRCLLDRVDRTTAHPKDFLLFATQERAGDLRPFRLAAFKFNPRSFDSEVWGSRAKRCLPVCRFGSGKAKAVSTFLKLSIRFGEIYVVPTRRAEA